ncbi:rho guanine nucleotide exchange factor at 64c isoform a [Holotrichia oblita]|uniref:Rho guanine nucleotide exchange factor at 64c isoform a n=1 Tax=Holotrichia oblita TaxID=644536 RepID=A0ACB9TT58_HOLOL|nr:rho guanine nucleotide exchange factor at 64c isoform a [Holotrichia oblita]
MRRYPITPPDADYSSYGFRSPSSSQSWSKSEEAESSLSRSMRYAEPWLYGSVRAPSGLLLTPALVLCSCADYLNGTKRSSKKGQTICKKCKGTRIPLNAIEASKFGTVRCYPTTPTQPTCVRAGTVKVSSSKSRPSILNTTGDPYDLMRRSRLAISDNAAHTQYRARSVSPSKNRSSSENRTASSSLRSKSSTTHNVSKYSTVGRKSILECNVNPYELMGTDDPQDASITLVNGQRIRVRPKVQEMKNSEYEDVQIRRQSSQRHSKSGHNYQQYQMARAKNAQSNTANNKLNPNEKESECNNNINNASNSNRFKSILKKPTTTFNDTDLRGGPVERSPSPARKSGSHFYLPLPANNSTPRKKVQFLVENELVSRENKVLPNDYETDNEVFVDVPEITECDDEKEENTDGEEEEKIAIPVKHNKQEESTTKESETSKEKGSSVLTTNSYKLRRTKSERKSQEAAKVLFHDTMALRLKSGRNDTRDVFTKKDLEKLDGVDPTKLKNFEKIRPRGPPPQPPASLNLIQSKATPEISETYLKLPDVPKLAPLASPECLIITQDRHETILPPLDNTFLNDKTFKKDADTNTSIEEKEFAANIIEKAVERSQKVMKNITQSRNDVSIEKKTKRTRKTGNVLEISSISSQNNLDDRQNVLETNTETALSITEDSKQTIDVPRKTIPESSLDIPKKSSGDDVPPPNDIKSNTNTENINDFLEQVLTIKKIEAKSPPQSNILDQVNYISSASSDQSENNESSLEFINSDPPAAPPRKKSNNRQSFTISMTNNHPVNVISPVIVNETTNKTIVKISSPVTPPVHKLKIRNEFPETNTSSVTITDNNLGKTSITINGDDCYCTVNVKDDVSIYQSSVVVKDSGVTIQPPERKSSSIYITGNFVTPLTTLEKIDDAGSIQDNSSKYEDIKEYDDCQSVNDSTSNYSKRINNQSSSQVNDQLIRENQKETTATNALDVLCSTEMLKQILCDPVEAVKRNLVPHVCGKSDVSRRPRSRKTIESDDLVASFLNDSLLNGTASIDQLPPNHVTQLIEESFLKLRNHDNAIMDDDKDVSSEHSSTTQYEIMDPGSDCYTDNSNRSSVTEEELSTRSKFYELLAESAVEVAESDDHHYESIKANVDPIYEEIEIPPPLPSNPPPKMLLDDLQLDKEYTTRSIFEGASKYDILSYLVDAKERGIVPEDSYTYNFNNSGIVVEDDGKESSESYNRVSHMSTVSDSSEESSLVLSNALLDDKVQRSIEVERNDSGVGSETSKSSLSKYRTKQEQTLICEDCDGTVDLLGENEPLICRKCVKKRTERKEIITEIVETEEKYSRDLQIILEEFYQPMLVAGLLTSDQLSAIFLNVEELLENSQALAERLRDAVEIATEQGDEDLLTVNIGKLILEAAPMLHAFETYCIRQGAASLLLAGLEKEKELLRIFLRVSQMENTVLRRMNLNSFLMVPVQRVTKYPLLLARLYKVTPSHHETREQLKEAQHKIELHLNHMNSETKDVPSKLWRRISSNNGRRSSSEMDLVNIKLRKIAVDVLEWNHDEARFALEGKLLFTQPTDNNWRKGRTIKLTPVNALLVTNGKVSNSANRPEPADEGLIFSRHSGVREAALLLVRDKNGRYSLLREPLYLDRCVIAADPAWQSYFEVQELLGKDTFIFKVRI